MTLGLALELLHGLKASFYLDPDHETRRLMWRLSHAHGTLLGLIQIAFAATITARADPGGRRSHLASRCLLAASILMPAGFFLGGLYTYGGDPGLGIFLVVPGALALATAVVLVALGSKEPS